MTVTETVSLRALSLPARAIIAVAVGALAAFFTWHMAAVFLFVSPSNTVREENFDRIRGYIYPEFEQNWKLFAPNPLQRDEAVHVRAQVTEPDGSLRTTDWINLTATDIDNIRHHLLPSHSAQNLLRRGWDFYDGAHDDEGRPIGERGRLSELYVHRIALQRLQDEHDMDLDTVRRVQLRSAVSRVPAPEWREEEIDTSTYYDEIDWWVVTSDDLEGIAR
ncbi:hypothetical protein D7319_05175 [Streptomyces radicis]|uniref:Uncharacterized protein n=1 Tax=Streptomyces radicis TaxID=1750517 RepID=A0A3A9WE63_9ACTN|nr:hypothetical protein D7319_05175 [Streptomyces radicis]RKN26848.1 hypothetical protein D7318_04480 [Streptomyces radicis]